jgi:protein gp37
MADRTAIEWTDATWTPVRARSWEIQSDGSGKERIGWHCEHVSEGCRNCYAERINQRLGTGYAYKPGTLRGKPGYAGGGTDRPELFLDETMLLAPLRWKKPRMIFVCSMSDLFADFVPDAWIDKVFAVMALSPQHTFQVLTKRPERMREYLSYPMTNKRVGGALAELSDMLDRQGVKNVHPGWFFERPPLRPMPPFDNVWLGTSIEDQTTADARVPLLLATPAALRFVSAEPLLGPIELTEISYAFGSLRISIPREPAPPTAMLSQDDTIGTAVAAMGGSVTPNNDGLDWVIVGGESGPHARPMHPDWVRALRDQCLAVQEARSGEAATGTAAKPAFFFKQWGEWAPHKPTAGGDLGGDVRAGRVQIVHPSGRSGVEIIEATGKVQSEAGSRYMARVGKKTAGALLDGREWRQWPEGAP